MKQFQTEDFQLSTISKRSHMVFHKNMPETFILWMFLLLYLKITATSLAFLRLMVTCPNHKHGDMIGRKRVK